MDMKKLIEAVDQFAGQAVGQKPGDQVRGTEKATKRKDDKHPFAGRLVGASESKSLLADLEKELVEGAVKRSLAEEFASFKEESDDMFAQTDRPKHLVAASKWSRGGDLSGTSLKGYVVTDYDTLVKTFGEPYYVSDDPDDKVAAEWVITFKDRQVATIYVYRTKGVVPKEQYRWHVGGVTPEVVDRVALLLGTRPATELDEATEGFGRNIYFRVGADKLPLAQAVAERISFHPTKKDGFWKYSVMKNERPNSVMQKIQQLEQFFGPRVHERELSKPVVSESKIAYDKRTGQMGVIEDDPQGVAEEMTPAGEFLNKQERLKAGNKVYYKGRVVGVATGDMDDDRVIFVPVPGYGTNPRIASLPIDVIGLRESNQFSELEIAIMEGGNSLDDVKESRIMHSDAKVNVFYKPGHNQTKAQMVARMVPNSQVNRIIASLVDKFGVKSTDFEWQPSDRDQYKFTAEGEEFGHQQNPQDSVSLDVPLLIRLLEYAREDAKTDMDLHNVAERLIKLSSEGQTLSMDQYDQICPSNEQTVDEDVPPSVPTAGGPAGANQPKTIAPAPGTPPAPGTAPVDPAQAALQQQNQAKLQQNLANLKSAGVQIDPAKAAQTLQKTNTGAPMNATDKDTMAAMAPALGNVMANPSTATQLNTLIKKAGGGV